MINIKEAIAVLKQFKEESQKHKDRYTPIGSNLSPVLKIMQDTYQENIDAFEMAIQALETIEKGVVPVDWHNDVYETIQKRYLDLLERTRWIPVSERMPTTGEYLVTDGDLISISFYSGNAKCFCGDEDDDVVANTTHWMSLPNPPQVVE